MKRYMLVCFATSLALVFASDALTEENPGTGIQNSVHDLSSFSGVFIGTEPESSLNRMCFYCHVPHSAIAPAKSADAGFTHYPIWNQAVTITSFQTYTNSMMATIGEPGGTSRLCLSCHDGTVASNVYGYIPPSAIWSSSQSAGSIVTGCCFSNLSHHHPIGFDYFDVGSKNIEINPATFPLLGAKVLRMTIVDLLRNGRMECVSCHDVHNTKNEGSELTWVRDYRSSLCFTCHHMGPIENIKIEGL